MFHHHRRPSEYVEVGEEYYPARERLGEDSTYVQEPGFYAAAGGGVPPVPYTSTGAAAARPYNYGPESSVYGRPNVYAARPPPPAVVYESEPERSDLGMGARDSRIVESTDYGAGYGRPDLTTPYVATAPGYVDGSVSSLSLQLQFSCCTPLMVVTNNYYYLFRVMMIVNLFFLDCRLNQKSRGLRIKWSASDGTSMKLKQ
jgi:hypothetical protein